MYGRLYSIPDLAKTACHQYEDDDTLASYMKRMFETKDISLYNNVPNETLPSQVGAELNIGDWVFMKMIKRKAWNKPTWEGPFQILITTSTAVKVKGRDTWIHKSHCKRYSLPSPDR